jgi:hypothetical protein
MLFPISAIRREDEEPGFEQPGAVHVAGDARFVVGRKKMDLQVLIGDLVQNETIHIPSMSSWSMHHVLAYVLSKTGPADVWITSWSITEEPIALIVEHLERGVIKSLRALFSERVEAMNPAAHAMARFNLQVKLAKIHAKTIVVMNDTWGVSVKGSANFTRNPRIENYVISTHREVAEGDRAWIDSVMDGADPFEAP